MSMEEVQSTSQIVELSGKVRVLLCELPLIVKERHRLLELYKEFPTPVDESTPISI